MIFFTKHAQNKFKILETHKFIISKQEVIEAVTKPDLIDYSRTPLLIAQKELDNQHVLRVVYKKERENIKIITFYPGRKKQYG